MPGNPLAFRLPLEDLRDFQERVSARRCTMQSPTSTARRQVHSEMSRSFRIRAGGGNCPLVVTLTTSATEVCEESLLSILA